MRNRPSEAIRYALGTGVLDAFTNWRRVAERAERSYSIGLRLLRVLSKPFWILCRTVEVR